MTTPTTPAPSLEDRVTILETRLDTVLPTLATKEDIARLEGKIETMAERFNGKTDRLDGKIDAVEERLNGKIDRLDAKIDAMEERFNGKLEAMEERFNGKLEAMEERFNGKIVQLDAKIDAMGNRLLVRFSVVAFAMLSIAVAAAKYL